MPQKYDDSTIIKWIKRTQKIGSDIVSDIFCIYLEKTIKHDFKGACHDLSASFYMTLSEYELKPVLCIGVVSANGSIFDHSWVEIGGRVYDFTICNQNSKSFPPVYNSINLETSKKTNSIYGVVGAALDEPAKTIAKLSIDEYKDIRPKDHLCMYKIGEYMGNIIPYEKKIKLSENELRRKYSNHKRVHRN